MNKCIIKQTAYTATGHQIAYPMGVPEITVARVILNPGEETGWHIHDEQIIGIITSGTICVNYDGGDSKIYNGLDVICEPIGVLHNGKNIGFEPVHIYVIGVGIQLNIKETVVV